MLPHLKVNIRQSAISFPVTDKTVTGYLSGDKAIYKLNKGKLTLTGDHSYTGGTFIQDGELELGNGGTTGSVIGTINIADQSLLTFNRNNLAVIDNVISGDGGVIQKGSGLTVINSHNSYHGATDILNGELMVNGSVISPVNIHADGALSGTGSTGAVFADNGSFISPGDFRRPDTGTLTVNGNAKLKQGSLLDIRVAKEGISSVLDVSGDINLNGSVIFNGGIRGTPLSVAETLNLIGKTSTFLKSGSGISGQFDEVKPTYRFIGAQLEYKSHQVVVSFAQIGKHFAEDATARN